MAREIVESAEKLIDQQLDVLDHGFVKLVDYMGGDRRIVEAARVSYAKGTKGLRKDRGLIRYLMQNKHTSPFEQVVLTFHIKLPIFIARQWIRHRTARVNEISGRYSVMEDECYLPEFSQLKMQSSKNKQCRDETPLSPEAAILVHETLSNGQQQSYEQYQHLLDTGLAREVARINLPLSIYTQWYWQIDLHNLFHFLQLRLHSHAQWEIREYANKLALCAKAVAPMAYEAFAEFQLGGTNICRQEANALQDILRAQEKQAQLSEPLQSLLQKLSNRGLQE